MDFGLQYYSQKKGAISTSLPYQDLVECITSAFGQVMPEAETRDVLASDRVIVAVSPVEGEIAGLATINFNLFKDYFFLSSQLPNIAPHERVAYLSGAAIKPKFRGKGLYGLFNQSRLKIIFDERISIVTTLTQNPKVEAGVISAFNAAVENGALKGYQINRYHRPGSYGRRLTNYPIVTNESHFAQLDMEKGDAFAYAFVLAY